MIKSGVELAVPPASDAATVAWLPRRRFAVVSVLVLVGVLTVFAAAAVVSRALFDETEDRLLEQRTKEAGAILNVGVATIRIPLESAVRMAEANAGDPDGFVTLLGPSVGDAPAPFSSAGLFEVGSTEPIATLGEPFETSPAELAAMISPTTPEYTVHDLLDEPDRRIGYAHRGPGETSHYFVYAERKLDPNPTERTRNDEPFAQLDYAFYLGVENPEKLLSASTAALPLTGRRYTDTVPFGDTSLILVMTPTENLSGDVFAFLPWIIVGTGIVIGLVAAGLLNRLLRRRDEAVRLANENDRLYKEQRNIAETLQLSLLPGTLNPPAGMQVAARYWPAGSTALVGGDFYDLFQIDGNRWGVVIGDVCGKGVEAAALTSLARHTVRAAARHLDTPSEVLRSVHSSMASHRPATFVTVCYMAIVVQRDGYATVTMSLGGHPQPVVCRVDGHVETVGAPGSLLGMLEPTLIDTEFTLAPGDTVVLYTDGLTDAPREEGVPLEEVESLLNTIARQAPGQIADEIRKLKRRRRPAGSHDDTAVVILQMTPAVGHAEPAAEAPPRAEAISR